MQRSHAIKRVRAMVIPIARTRERISRITCPECQAQIPYKAFPGEDPSARARHVMILHYMEVH